MMATYFHGGSEIQAAAAAAGGGGGGGGGDQNLQTLYLMNPNLIAAYSEAQPPSNMLFLNHSNNFSQGNFPHAPPPAPSAQQQQQFVGIPLSGPHPTEDHGRPPPSPSSSGSIHHHHNNNNIPGALHGLSVSRVHPNLWSPVNNHPIRPASQPQSDPSPNTPSGPDMGDQMGFRRPMAAQGLSLSLSPGMQMQPQPNQSQVTVAGASTTNGNGVIPGSKYLKAAQELLEEVVNVGSNTNFITNNNNKPCTDTGNGNGNGNGSGTNLTGDSSGAHKEKATVDQSEGFSHGGISVGGGGGGECSSGVSTMKPAELSTAQRQELQMKKAKLLNMLDEVEQRYRQYNTQMQVVVSSFEQAAGSGSAKLYTSLALKTISKQFRCLKDAIMSQIKATSNSLGEEDGNGNNTNTTVGVKLEGGAGSRLRFVDHQLRQQRALQQLGMMQHNAWRPQRGLPERAVSVLRAWLFEHFLHPYPKDSDKHMLAKQTGLTRSQVSNWFINARVRLWKPMVEEMYLEEIKTQEQNNTNNNNNSEDNTTTINTSTMNKNTNASKPETSTTKEQVQAGPQDHGIQEEPQEQQQITNDMISNISATSSQGFTLIGSSSDMESLMGLRRSPKKQRSNSDIQNSSPSSILSMDMEMKAVDHHHHHQQQQQRQSFLINHRGGTEFNNPYIVNDEMGGRSFNPGYHGNAVSLTLGLPHGDNLSLGNHHQNFLPNHQAIPLARRLDNIGAAAADTDFCGISMAQPSHPNNNGFETIDIQNRKRFAAQILHDFVA
ncbi:BEL1-like homeodomain protein 1 [Bienertia sinuspersici]